MLIKVKTLDTNNFEMDIEPTDKVETIKQKIEEKLGTPATIQRLIYEKRLMKNQMTAEDFKIQEGSTVYMTLHLPGYGSWNTTKNMLIKVKTLTGKEIELDIDPTDKVERIKEKVEEKEGIPPPQQRLIFSGKQMNEDKTASDYKVTGGSVIHLVLALRGGF